jgi:hypothetical protein
MTYPTEFLSQAKTIGPTALKHPIYTFKVNLDLQRSESIGPNTNQRDVNLLHPDQHQTSPDLGRSQNTVRRLQNISWLPGMLAAGNVYINDDGTITAYGQAGQYLRENFTTGTYPLLTLTNAAPYTAP